MPPSTRGRLLAVCCLVVGLALVTVAAAGVVSTAAIGPSGGPSAATATPPQPADDLDLPARMDLQGEVTHGSAVVGVDVGGAIQRDSAQLAGSYERSRFEARLESAENASRREATLVAAYDDADATFTSLREAERRVLQSYQAGRLDAAGVLFELRSIHVRAQAQASMLSLVMSRSNSINATYFTRAETLLSRYRARQGILREELGAIAAGQQSPRRFYVASSGSGVLLSRVGPSGYAREVVRGELLVVGREPRLAWDDVPSHIASLYPAFAADNNFGLQHEASPHVVQIGGDHGHGQLEFYVDRYTQDVFREYQRLDLADDLPTVSAGDVSSGPVTLRVNRTYPTGPARVVVTEAVERGGASGDGTGTNGDGSDGTDGETTANATTVQEPVEDVPIAVGGTEVARTGEDGVAWVVLPYGESDVTATVDDRELSVHVDWTPGGGDAKPVGSQGADDASA